MRQVPTYTQTIIKEKQNENVLVIPVINEGQRIQSLLSKIKALNITKTMDICIIDGGSTDGSLQIEKLKDLDVNYLLVKTGPGALSAQLRCAYDFVLNKNYQNIVTIDGNDKDDPSSLPLFLQKLSEGYDFVQGSRFIKGGVAENTPLSRYIAIRCIHAPMLSIFSGQKWTDTTQGYRAYSRKLLESSELNIFRDIFVKYELLAFLSLRAPQLNFKCTEVPTKRAYPATGKTPTKIKGFRGNLVVLNTLFDACFGKYN